MGARFSNSQQSNKLKVSIDDEDSDRRRDYRSFNRNNNNNLQSTITASISSQGQILRQPVPRRLEPQFQTNTNFMQKKNNWYQAVYFTPQSKFIIFFDTVRLVLIYLYFLEIPITIAFENHRKEEESEKIFEEINIPAIIIFIVSIFIKLKTAFYKEGVLISDQQKILQNYFVYSFVFDFLSIISICVYQFSEILKPKDDSPNIYRFFVIFFFLKTPQVFSIQRSMITAFDLNRRIKAFIKLILLVMKIFLICNIAACGFFYLSDNYCPCKECCWVQGVMIMGKSLKQSEWSVQYTFALYWASTTMLTIGYGDITPLNNSQVAYTVASQFISCVVFAFSVNSIWSIILQKNIKKAKIRSRMNVINVYMRDKNVNVELKSRINAYLAHFYYTKNLRQKQLENQIISQLTPSLKKQLYFQTFGFIFKSHKFFKNFSQNCLEQASQFIKQVGYFQQQIVFQPQKSSFQPNSLYYVHKGDLQLFLRLGNFLTADVSLMNVEKGMMMGLNNFIKQVDYSSWLRAKKYSLLYILDYESWINTLREWDEDFQRFFQLKHKILYEKNNEILKLSCKICGNDGHLSEFCLDQEIRKNNANFLQKYLAKNKRRNFKRGKLRSALDIKSGKCLQISIQEQKNSKNFLSKSGKIKNQQHQRILATMHQKKLFKGPKHQQQMSGIIHRQKLKESIWSEQSQSDEFIINECQIDLDRVRNFQTYCPLLNASADWGRQRRRITLNKLLLMGGKRMMNEGISFLI